jgi:hypothetical protein
MRLANAALAYFAIAAKASLYTVRRSRQGGGSGSAQVQICDPKYTGEIASFRGAWRKRPFA